jgi:hypothetical protein
VHQSARAPWWLIVLGAIMLVGLSGLVFASLRRATPPTFPIDVRSAVQVGDRLVHGRITLDARADDRWAFFDFSRDAAVPEPDSLGWDLAVRRTRWMVNGGDAFAGRAGALAIESEFDRVERAPERGYLATTVSAGDSANAVFEKWYRYDYLSHLLWPRPVTYVIRTADGRYAKLFVVSYYCPGPEPGCVSFRYAYQGDGSRQLTNGGE